jgi:hypothetical protein
VFSTGRAVAGLRRGGSSVCTCWVWFHDHIQQVHTELPPLIKTATARPVLNTVCGLSAFPCTPDDGHNDARKM